MKTRLLTALAPALILALAVMAMVSGPVSAQGDNCFGDVVSFQACFDTDRNMTVTYIAPDAQGYYMGVVPGSVFRYAAANMAGNSYVGSLLEEETGAYMDLYFVDKMQINETEWATMWTMLIYNADGEEVSRYDFTENAIADPAAPPPSLEGNQPSAPPAGGGEVAAGEGEEGGGEMVVGGVGYSGGEFEPIVVQPGTVEECMVRSTYTVRLRNAPTTAGGILDSVPFGTSMPSDMVTVDGEWSRVYYVGEGGTGQLGWVFNRYLEMSEACADIDQVAPIGEGEMIVIPTGNVAAAGEGEGEMGDGGDGFDPTFGGVIDLTIVQPGTVAQCIVRTRYTVRMRFAPTTDAPMMVNVPYRSSMPSDLVTSDGEWMRTYFVGEGGTGYLGWVYTRYLELSEACADLSAIAPVE
ncbi:MAG: SH3 domain-containing protein [Anaerolineae bacterium]|nr:SH3 domain-containing protein [Anaerolineae bacterium]